MRFWRSAAAAAAGVMLMAGLCGAAAAQFNYSDQAYRSLAGVNESIPPGTKITTQNWQQYRRFLPIGLQALYSGQYFWKIGSEPDYAITVAPAIPIPLPDQYRKDTEQYSGQVKLRKLESGGYTIDGYTA